MTALAAPIRAGAAQSAWRTHLSALALAAAALLALFHRDAAHMASIWWTSSTFNHCLLILPILVWLVWQRKDEVAPLVPAGWAPGLALVAAGALAWLLGEAAGVALARHLGLVVMLQGAAVAILGRAVAAALAFPIFYALFLVPAGEELVPPMQVLTADMSMALLGLSGVPAHIEGIFITTPSGYFEVAEACAGVKFLIAMAAFGALVANVCFRSWPRRIAFMAAALIIPVLANGMRAWGTMYIADMAGIEFAAGFDHIFYGWIFFALVIALTLAVAWRFFDRGPSDPWLAKAPREGRRAPLALVLGGGLAIAAAAPAWSAFATRADAPPDPAFMLPELPGWTREAPGGDWSPRFAGADLIRAARYRDAEGRGVDLVLAIFARQEEGRELVGYGQGAAEGWSWSADAPAPPGGRAERIASGGLAREVRAFYRIGDVTTGSRGRVKIETMKARLFGGPQHAAALFVSAPAGDAAALDDLLRALGPVEALVDRAAGR